jgi:hypothetical protein
MKLFGARLFLAVMFAMSLAGAVACQTRPKAFKGWELYSWMDGTEWRFSLLVGTNRLKFCEEIKNPKGAMTLDKAERALRELALVEHVSWRDSNFGPKDSDCGLAYPPPEIVARLRELCRRLELNLSDSALPAAEDRR